MGLRFKLTMCVFVAPLGVKHLSLGTHSCCSQILGVIEINTVKHHVALYVTVYCCSQTEKQQMGKKKKTMSENTCISSSLLLIHRRRSNSAAMTIKVTHQAQITENGFTLLLAALVMLQTAAHALRNKF